jgi:hypothetical protein
MAPYSMRNQNREGWVASAYVREEWGGGHRWSGHGRRSFPQSFHLALLGLSGAHWLDSTSDLTCRDRTQQHAADDPLLSCKQLAGIRRARLWHLFPQWRWRSRLTRVRPGRGGATVSPAYHASAGGPASSAGPPASTSHDAGGSVLVFYRDVAHWQPRLARSLRLGDQPSNDAQRTSRRVSGYR